jgi:septum formation protein
VLSEQSPLLLASASPRRREILETLGVPVRVLPASVDETVRVGESPRDYLARVVDDKLAAASLLASDDPRADGVAGVLVADTSVIVDARILGKPVDEADARAMLRLLSGRAHEVWTRFALRSCAVGAPTFAETVVTRVVFRALDAGEIDGYAASGEGLDKAGAYAVQGLGAFAVARIEGSYANVVGLPACEVVAALRRAGLIATFPLPGR